MSSIHTWVNGQSTESVHAHDRGLLYGQGVFETITVYQQQPLLLEQHLTRLHKGCDVIGIPYDESQIIEEINAACDYEMEQALNQNKAYVLRVSLSMAAGGRGYQNPDQPSTTRVVSLHEFPHYPLQHWQQGIELGLSEVRLSSQPLLAGIKHANRLEQVLARSQWQDNWQEAILMDQHDYVIEGTQSNVFIYDGQQLLTPDLSDCGVSGVMRDFIISKVSSIDLSCKVTSITVDDLRQSEAMFVTNSLIGLWPVKRFQQRTYTNFTLSQNLLSLMQAHDAIPTF